MFPALEYKHALVGGQDYVGEFTGHQFVVVAAGEDKKHRDVTCGTFHPVAEDFLRFLKFIGGIHENIHPRILFLEALYTLEYAVVIAHITQAAGGKQEYDLRRYLRKIRLVVPGA